MILDKEVIKNCYLYILGRQPSDEEMKPWESYEGNFSELCNGFLGSEEFRAKYEALRPSALESDSESFDAIVDYTDNRALNSFKWVISVSGKKDLDPIKYAIVHRMPFLTDEVYQVEKLVSVIHGSGKKTMLDLGANVGKFAFPFEKLGWNVLAVEAADDNYRTLELTKKINDLNVNIMNNIIYDHTGVMYFYANGPYGMCSKNKDSVIHSKVFSGVEPLEVSSICLDDWEKTNISNATKIDFIKMDIEGSEVAAIRGGKEFLDHYDYPSVFCESNKWTLYTQGETPQQLVRVFRECGYIPFVIVGDKLMEIGVDYVQIPCNSDYLFVHGKRINCSYEMMHQSTDEISNGLLKELLSENMMEALGSYYCIKKEGYSVSKEIKDQMRLLEQKYFNEEIWEYALRSV